MPGDNSESHTARLYRFVKRGVKLNDSWTVRQALSHIMGLKGEAQKDNRRLLSIVVEAIHLADRSRSELKNALPEGEFERDFASCYSTIDAAFTNFRLDAHWKAVVHPLRSVGAVHELKHAAAHVQRANLDHLTLAEDELKEIVAVVDHALELVIESSLTQQFKTEVIEHLDAVKTAVRNYDMAGTGNVRWAFGGTVGVIVAHHGEFQRVKGTEVGKGLFRFLEVVGRILGAAGGGAELYEAVKTLLLKP